MGVVRFLGVAVLEFKEFLPNYWPANFKLCEIQFYISDVYFEDLNYHINVAKMTIFRLSSHLKEPIFSVLPLFTDAKKNSKLYKL